MQNILSDIWNGNISVGDRCGILDPEVKKLVSLLSQNRQSLKSLLSPEQLPLFETYNDHYEEYLLRLMEHAFCDGFRVASQLLVEALADVT